MPALTAIQKDFKRSPYIYFRSKSSAKKAQERAQKHNIHTRLYPAANGYVLKKTR